MTLWLRALALTALLLSTGCAQAHAVTGKSRARIAGTRGLPPAIPVLLRSLRSAYLSADWPAVRRDFSDTAAAADLVDAMHGWMDAGATSLTVSVLSSARLDAHDREVTVRFADDPRASPSDRLYTVHLSGNHAVISGLASGLRGTSYRTATWSITRTAHFTVYHSPYQLAGADRAVLSQLESQRVLVARKFHVTLPPSAALYLFPNDPAMKALTIGPNECGNGGEIGCTSPFTHPPTIEALRPAVFHEAIHVYQLAFVPPSPDGGRTVFVAPLFIAEGMAVALQDPEVDPSLSDYCSDLAFRPLDFCARVSVHRVHAVAILSDKGFKTVQPSDAYAMGGSFVSYLIRRHGYLSFKTFYYTLAHQPSDRLIDYNLAARAAYGTGIMPLLQAWVHSLCSTCSP